MKSKTRYNIRLAQRRGVKVETSQNLEIFNKLMQITSERDQFGIHSSTYYQTCYDLFSASGKCELLVAEYQGLPLASIMIFRHGKRAWYFYGASSNEHREYMATYLLQWEAIRWARSQECISYDLWGVPDEDEVSLELNFNKRTDGLWGVYRFKRGFGGTLNRAAGPWDRVYLAPFYAFYRMISQRKNILN